jgi:O-antigen ligase
MLSVVVVIVLFYIYVVFWRRELFARAAKFGLALTGIGFVSIYSFNMQHVWLNRVHTFVLSLIDILSKTITKFLLPISEKASSYSSPIFKNISDGWCNSFNITRSSNYLNDVNVTTRIEEYRIAWKMFLEHPIFGNGLGVKHEISFATSFGNVLTQKVGYIHNWPLYFLMVGGVVGFALYSYLLFIPLFKNASRHDSHDVIYRTLFVGLLTLSIYGLFFAVFRLITFNLLLAVAWGIVSAAKTNSTKEIA